MVKTNKLGLIGRCFLAGTLAVTGLVQGCQPLSYVQEQRLGTLTGLAIRNQEQKARNEAITNSGGNVVVSIGNGEKDWNDFIEAKNGYQSRCKILWENDEFICYRNHNGKYKMLKSDYKRWVYNKY